MGGGTPGKSCGLTKPKTPSYGKELILSISMEGVDMTLNFGVSWEDHLRGDVQFKQLLKEALDKLVERPSKGDGKGKVGKLTLSA